MIEGKNLQATREARNRDIPFGGGGGGRSPAGEVTDPQLIDNIGDNLTRRQALRQNHGPAASRHAESAGR